jgi:hypothetical protein
MTALEVLGAEREDVLERDALDRGVAAEVPGHELLAEPVDAGGHGRVRGEDGRRADRLERGGEGQPLALDELADALDGEEAGVALVAVVDLRGRPAGDARVEPHGAHAAHAEQELLLEAVLGRAAVQAVGDLALALVVVRDVRVQQEQRHATDLSDPHLGAQHAAAGQGQLDAGGGAVRLAQERQRQVVRVDERVGLVLPALAGQRLLEVAGAVQQPDADDRHAEVGRGLQVVAGEDAEAARVLGQHVGDAVLGGEVGDRRRLVLGPLVLEPLRLREVGREVGAEVGHAGDEVRVDGELLEPGAAERAEQGDRVAADGRPELRVEGLEQRARRLVPAPPEVGGELVERGKRVGQDGADRETADGSHRWRA